MRRLVETYVLPAVYVAVLGLMAYAAALLWLEDPAAVADLDRTPRAEYVTNPPWQPVSVTGGVRSDIVRPSEVGR